MTKDQKKAKVKVAEQLSPSASKAGETKVEIVDTMLEMAAIPFFVEGSAPERQEPNTPTIQEMADAELVDAFDDDDDDTIRVDLDDDEEV